MAKFKEAIDWFIYFILVFTCFILLSSCSANWHLTRALKKDPGIIDTSYVEHDTTVKISISNQFKDSLKGNFLSEIQEIPEVRKLSPETIDRIGHQASINITRPMEQACRFDTIKKVLDAGGWVKVWRDSTGVGISQKLPTKTVRHEVLKQIKWHQVLWKHPWSGFGWLVSIILLALHFKRF